ncbi:fibronectin type III domain-containing protein [Streptomyces sp. NBC_00470]|uniref:fibronectin type III domain-containing protein n=1 Tax=Streptomyces sp. NBC_00470 TaxID=2975753 RepID=UPI0030DDE7AC
MAEDEKAGGGGGGIGKSMNGTIDLPGLGPAKKKYVFAIVGIGAAFILYRYYKATNEAQVAGDSDGDGFADGGILPQVAGQGGPIGDGSGDGPNVDQFGFQGITNSQWTQYAVTQLSASDRWSYTDIVEALGQYLANKPLTATQQAIVQAAIAAAGPPPVGQHVVVPGGNVPITVAPAGLAASNITSDSVDLKWGSVPGAASYRVYRSGSSTNIATSNDGFAKIDGLNAGTAYTFYVSAVSSSGSLGPKSAGVKATTKESKLVAPKSLKVTKRTRSSVTLTWGKVPNASGYRAYHNKSSNNVGSSVDGVITVSGLKPNTKYRWHVRATDNNGKVGPSSATVSGYTTK